MATRAKYQAELVQEDQDFVIKVQIALPSLEKATEFGEWLHETIRQRLEAKGATIVRDNSPSIAKPGLILQ